MGTWRFRAITTPVDINKLTLRLKKKRPKVTVRTSQIDDHRPIIYVENAEDSDIITILEVCGKIEEAEFAEKDPS